MILMTCVDGPFSSYHTLMTLLCWLAVNLFSLTLLILLSWWAVKLWTINQAYDDPYIKLAVMASTVSSLLIDCTFQWLTVRSISLIGTHMMAWLNGTDPGTGGKYPPTGAMSGVSADSSHVRCVRRQEPCQACPPTAAMSDVSADGSHVWRVAVIPLYKILPCRNLHRFLRNGKTLI